MTSQKTLDVTIDLPQDLQDIGFKELIVKRENGIIKMVDDSIVLFPFNLDKYKKSIEELQKRLNRKIDERIIIIACSKITDVIVNYDFDGNGDSSSSNGSSNSNNTNTETRIILEEISVLVEGSKDLPYEIWHEELTKRYQKLRQFLQTTYLKVGNL